MIKILKYSEVSDSEIFARSSAVNDVSNIVSDIIDDVIKRFVRFKRNNNKIYMREDILNKSQKFELQGGKKDGE